MPPKKQKSAKEDNESKKSQKTGKKTTSSEDVDQEQREREQEQGNNQNLLNDIGDKSISEMSKQEPIISPEEPVDVKYEEPVLTSIIVENYEGEKDKGLFEGFGKAVYKGGNIYEGEFHLGMMNGKGKYIWSNGIIYEGDFINNEINGYGSYKWCNPLNDQNKWSKYEGQVFKGKRHGNGVFKSGNSPIVYEGEWYMGKRHGKGKMYYSADFMSYYEGDWVNNRKFGWGIRHYPSGNEYIGMWVNDIRHGEGTMKWFDKNQIYTGQWENGIQNGLGEHNWYLARVEMTQFTLRNTYYGNFKNGKRHGQGTFLYANGSKYEGNWENNLKHGWGRFTFKDGQIYEGYFEEDKMTDSPTYNKNSRLAQEISKIKTRIPSAGTTLNIHKLKASPESSRIEFDLKLDLSSILNRFETEQVKELELTQAHKTIIRYLDLFKQVYRFYSQLGFDSSPDNTYVLNRMQFWRFLKDCKVHLNENYLTLMDFDRLLNPKMNVDDLHCPYDKILIREFFNNIVLIAYYLYNEQYDGSSNMISWCIEKLIEENILPYSCKVKDVRKTLNILTHMVKAYEIYQFLCKKRTKLPNDFSITMRSLLNILNEYKLLNNNGLSTKDVINVMASDNPFVFDSENCYNLDLEITFMEFFETLIGCALKYNFNNNETENRLSTFSAKTLDTSIEQNISIEDNNMEQEILIDELKKETGEMKQNQDECQKLQEENLVSFQTENIEITNEKIDRKELDLWIERNNLFFLNKFFPAAENNILLNKLTHISL